MYRNLRAFFCLILALALCNGVFVSVTLSDEFQATPLLLQASSVLPQDLIMGPNYTVRSTVIGDGLVNTYDLDTVYGPTRVESGALLVKRISELRALAQMEQLKKTDVYMKALTQVASGKRPDQNCGRAGCGSYRDGFKRCERNRATLQQCQQRRDFR
jgi:hypothetical protein